MAVPKRADLPVLAALPLFVALGASAAVPELGSEAINLSADVVNSDPRNDVHVMSGNVRVTQGQMSMEAEQATATALRSDHSRWTFERSVQIRTAQADLKSNTASAVFAAGQIAEATVKGTPASFEQRSATADKNVRGRANVIEYDVTKGTVKLTQDVWFSYGGNEFRGDTVIYNINDERVVVNPGGNNSGSGGRVNITIRPGSGTILPGSQPTPQTAPQSTIKAPGANQPGDNPAVKPPGQKENQE